LQPILITWQDILIALVAVLAVYIAEVLLLMRFRARRTPAAAAPESRAEIDALRGELQQVREQMLALKEGLERDKPRETPTGYAQAIELARQGLDGETLAARCGVSRAEAELILALHQARPK
jgi:hypothetical protein